MSAKPRNAVGGAAQKKSSLSLAGGAVAKQRRLLPTRNQRHRFSPERGRKKISPFAFAPGVPEKLGLPETRQGSISSNHLLDGKPGKFGKSLALGLIALSGSHPGTTSPARSCRFLGERDWMKIFLDQSAGAGGGGFGQVVNKGYTVRIRPKGKGKSKGVFFNSCLSRSCRYSSPGM